MTSGGRLLLGLPPFQQSCPPTASKDTDQTSASSPLLLRPLQTSTRYIFRRVLITPARHPFIPRCNHSPGASLLYRHSIMEIFRVLVGALLYLITPRVIELDYTKCVLPCFQTLSDLICCDPFYPPCFCIAPVAAGRGPTVSRCIDRCPSASVDKSSKDPRPDAIPSKFLNAAAHRVTVLDSVIQFGCLTYFRRSEMFPRDPVAILRRRYGMVASETTHHYPGAIPNVLRRSSKLVLSMMNLRCISQQSHIPTSPRPIPSSLSRYRVQPGAKILFTS